MTDTKEPTTPAQAKRLSTLMIDGSVSHALHSLADQLEAVTAERDAHKAKLAALEALAAGAREAQPLTDDQLCDMLGNVFDSDDETFIRFAREIEKHYGIKGGQEND